MEYTLEEQLRLNFRYDIKEGDILESELYGNFELIWKCSKRSQVRFQKTGLERWFDNPSIKSGKIKDYMMPKLCGVGYIGEEPQTRTNLRRLMHKRWEKMINKCYNENHRDYKKYGAVGVTVDKRWHSFKIFISDVVLLEGYDQELVEKSKLHLDKDFKQEFGESKVYSKETCIWVDPILNSMFRKDRQRIFVAEKEGLKIYSKNMAEFGREHNIYKSSIASVLSGKFKQCKGWTFKWIDEGGEK